VLNGHAMVLTHACRSDSKATHAVSMPVWGMYYMLKGKTPSLPLGEICGAVIPKMLASHNDKPFLSPKDNNAEYGHPERAPVFPQNMSLFKIYGVRWGRNDHVGELGKGQTEGMATNNTVLGTCRHSRFP
uniref:Uncharacterized protein n=1 Tax=Ursus maritimus TaxID=29073 RepID=A0A452V8G3_URSMA